MTADLAREAAATLRANPLRAALAALAVAAAVFAVAVIVTALRGVEESARRASVRAFGSDTFLITRVAMEESGRRELADKLQRNPVLKRADARALAMYADGDVLYAPLARRRGDVSAGGITFENARIDGTTAALAGVRDLAIAQGRFLSDADLANAAPVAVLGADPAETLFPAADPIGRSVRIGGRRFTIVGVQSRQGTAGGLSLDRDAWIPLTAYERIWGADPALQIFARAADDGEAQAAEELTRAILRARRSIQPGRPDTFDIVSPRAARSFVERLSERVGAAGVPISIMALLAAVAVVTNTMLVSVAQRTHEIGVRRAMGARRRDVLLEVLFEAALIASVGGAAGVLSAVAALQAAAGLGGLPLEVTLPVAVASVAAAAVSGILSGVYPARRAARLNVIAALRQE
jgi:putative ABC transport system permease protein